MKKISIVILTFLFIGITTTSAQTTTEEVKTEQICSKEVKKSCSKEVKKSCSKETKKSCSKEAMKSCSKEAKKSQCCKTASKN